MCCSFFFILFFFFNSYLSWEFSSRLHIISMCSYLLYEFMGCRNSDSTYCRWIQFNSYRNVTIFWRPRRLNTRNAPTTTTNQTKEKKDYYENNKTHLSWSQLFNINTFYVHFFWFINDKVRLSYVAILVRCAVIETLEKLNYAKQNIEKKEREKKRTKSTDRHIWPNAWHGHGRLYWNNCTKCLNQTKLQSF